MRNGSGMTPSCGKNMEGCRRAYLGVEQGISEKHSGNDGESEQPWQSSLWRGSTEKGGLKIKPSGACIYTRMMRMRGMVVLAGFEV